MKKKIVLDIIFVLIVAVLAYFAYSFITKTNRENVILKKMVKRLEADSRIAEALVVKTEPEEGTGKELTTIKFLEYGMNGEPLKPKYFTFPGNVLQFESLVIRFDDAFVRNADRFRGKSIYLFWKVFMLDGAHTVEYDLTKLNGVPAGYSVNGGKTEKKFWADFWKYALDPKKRKQEGIKNAQIEAPGTKFVPGMIYTLKIEHDGGIRIDSSEIPPILKGEKISE